MNDQMIGVVASGDIAVGLVQGHELVGKLRIYPAPEDKDSGGFEEIHSIPIEAITETIAQIIQELCAEHGAHPVAAGGGFSGIIRGGIIEDSPNLKQAKGAKMVEMLVSALAGRGVTTPVNLFNDADVMAAGIAATRGQLEKLIRVWT